MTKAQQQALAAFYERERAARTASRLSRRAWRGQGMFDDLKWSQRKEVRS